MAQILDIASYRKKALSEPKPEPVYFCTRCHSDHFNLHTGGDVRCVDCGAVMRNIGVVNVDRSNTGK